MPSTGTAGWWRKTACAWFMHCEACRELVKDQQDLIYEKPGEPDEPGIQIFQCRACGATRSCRAGYSTRCHVCLDERSAASELTRARDACLAWFAQDPLQALQAGRNLSLAPGEAITARAIVEATSSLTIAAKMSRYERPGWTVLATDVHGLPWDGVAGRSVSHGTWGQHDACGAVAKLRRGGTLDCPSCGPQPGSRTHEARRDEPYYLYLVTTGRVQKFGVGTEARVRAHQRAGATVTQVLTDSFAEVCRAERDLKKMHADLVLRKAPADQARLTYADWVRQRRARKMPASFGRGTEVVGRGVTISLTGVLPGGRDVTAQFARAREPQHGPC